MPHTQNLIISDRSARLLPRDRRRTKVDCKSKHLARGCQPADVHPSHKRDETEAAVGGDAGYEEDEEDEDVEVGPPKTALEGRKDERADDSRGGCNSPNEDKRGRFHVERRLSKEDRRRGDRRKAYQPSSRSRLQKRVREGVPSERRNHAARYLNVCCSRFIWDQWSITPSRFHAATISDPTVHLSSPSASSRDELGNQIAAGIENSIHHKPLNPIARRSENVEPCHRVTGTSARRSKRMPAQ